MNCSVPAYMGKTLVQSMEASNSNHHTLSLHSRTVPPSSTVLPSIPRGGRPKLPDSQLLSMEKELQCSTVAAYTTHLVSNSGEMGHLYAPCSMISSERHLSSLSTNEEPLGGGSFIPRSSTSNATVSIPLAYPPHSGSFQSQKLNDYPKEFMDAQWSADTIGELLDFTDNVSVDCHQNDGTVASENVSKRNEWDWLSNGSNITPNWNELFPEATVAEHGPEFIDPPPKLLASVSVEQPPILQQQPPTSSGDLCASASPVTSVNCAPARQRMRWTQEKHERFVEAVNQIGGCEKATPKAILKLMNYDDLTIYHVKSHLQKYRNARYRPDSSEGTSVKSNAVLDNMSSLDLKSGIGITEALQLQMEVQKRLHEQLEIQRNLQLKIEEQGRYLQMMFEKQCKTNINKIKAPTTTEAQTWEVTSANNTNAASDKDQNEKGSIDIGANTSVDNCRKVGGKQKIMAPRISDDVVNQNPCSRLYSPLAKRAKGSYPGLSSVPSTSF